MSRAAATTVRSVDGAAREHPSAPDERPRPQYGEYATPEEQRARIQQPDATWALETGQGRGRRSGPPGAHRRLRRSTRGPVAPLTPARGADRP